MIQINISGKNCIIKFVVNEYLVVLKYSVLFSSINTDFKTVFNSNCPTEATSNVVIATINNTLKSAADKKFKNVNTVKTPSDGKIAINKKSLRGRVRHFTFILTSFFFIFSMTFESSEVSNIFKYFLIFLKSFFSIERQEFPIINTSKNINTNWKNYVKPPENSLSNSVLILPGA